MKRFALALVAGLVVGLAAPAFAQTGPTARITNPNDGQVLQGSLSVSGRASAATGVKTAKLFIGDTLVASAAPENLRQDVDLSYSWDTTSALGGGASTNGWYQVRVEMTANGGGSTFAKINVMVDNAPQAPSNFDGYVQDTTASLSWSPNPEPDITGYRIEIGSGDSWTTATEVTATSYTTTLQPGTYQFRVAALRSSPNSPNGHASAPSDPMTLTIQAPPSSSGGGVVGGRGGRGSTGGGDPRIYGRDGAASTSDVKNTARSFSGGGLSFGGLSLPGQLGLPSLPTSESFKWGTYKERLPYSLPEGGIPLDAAPPRLAALSTTTILPLDALQWVAAGALMLVIAGLLQFVGLRAEAAEKLRGSQTATS